MTPSLPEDIEPLERYAPLPEGDIQFPSEYCEANGAVVLARDGDRAMVGLCDPEDLGLRESLKGILGSSTTFVRIDRSELASWLGKRMGHSPDEGLAKGSEGERILLDRLANDAPVINYLNSVLIDAIRAGASDVHISAFEKEAVIRYRVDGRLQVAGRIPKERFPALSSRVKIMANLNIMERRLPQDGRLTVNLEGTSVDMRTSIVPTSRGESIVLRLFGRADEPLSLDQLGMPADVLDRVRGILKVPHGLVLVTGPTGSGKTTTLNAMLRSIRSDEMKFLTVEDPVEYMIDGIDQIQTNEQIKLGFDSVLRRILRQDPDVIMVGEIRDHPTADLVVRAALTGHLVLSTLHTNDAVSAVTRLRNIGVEPYLVGSTLRAVLAQRLVRRVCPACAKHTTPSPGQRALFERWNVKVKKIPVAVGCPNCRGTGYSGRFAVFEYVENDAEFEDLISRGERTNVLSTYACSKGTVPLAAAALAQVAAGITTLEEIEREVET